MSDAAAFEIWGVAPGERDESRIGLWPEVNLAVPVHPDRSADADVLAVKRVVLPRVPVAGEQVEVVGRWASVEKVRWERTAPPTVRTQPLLAVAGLLEGLEADGFRLVRRDDADEELSRLLAD
jgi:hypothetical protein